MSFELMRQVWSLDLSPTEQQVLMAMADFANDDGDNCFPSHGRLAWKTGYSERTVARAINGFIESGVVIVLRLGTNKAPPRYQICLNVAKRKVPYCKEAEDSRGDPLSPQSDAGGDPVSSPNSLGRSSVASGGDPVSTWGDRGSPDPIINQSSNQSVNGNVPFPEKAEKRKAPETAAETAQKWATCKQELGLHRPQMGAWLQGSELIATGGNLGGKPLYRLLVVDARSVDWLKHQAERAIRDCLRTFYGLVSPEIVSELERHPRMMVVA